MSGEGIGLVVVAGGGMVWDVAFSLGFSGGDPLLPFVVSVDGGGDERDGDDDEKDFHRAWGLGFGGQAPGLTIESRGQPGLGVEALSGLRRGRQSCPAGLADGGEDCRTL